MLDVDFLKNVPGFSAYLLQDLVTFPGKSTDCNSVDEFRFQIFLRSTYIYIPDGLELEIKNALSCKRKPTKPLHFAEVMKAAVEQILELGKNCRRDNVLVNFNVKFEILRQCDFGNPQSILKYPGFQQIFAFLDDSNWNRLLLLIGNKAMIKIVTHCSIFYELTPSNYIQLCGFPLYKSLFFGNEKHAEKAQFNSCLPETSKEKQNMLSVSLRHTLPENNFCTDVVINWSWILYKYPLDERFPLGHFMSKALPNDKFAAELALHIYSIEIQNMPVDSKTLYEKLGNFKLIHANSKGLVSNFNGAVELRAEMKHMMRLHRRCFFRRIVRKYCPHRMFLQKRKLKQEGEDSDQKWVDPKSLISDWTDPKLLIQILKAIGRKVIPENLLGKRNRRIFLNNSLLITQVSKTTVIRLSMLIRGIEVDDIGWLSYIPTAEEKIMRLSQLILWLFSGYFLPLIQGFFHVTTSNVNKDKVMFFQKCIWNHIEKNYLKTFIDQGIFKEICHASAMPLDHCVGYVKSKLRILPTSSSLRPILLRIDSKMDPRAKFRMGDSLAVLQGIVFHTPQLLGFAKRDVKEAMEAWESFVLSYKTLYSDKQLYFVKVDINACYTSMLQDKVMSIVRKAFQESKQLHLVSYYQVKVPRGGKICKIYVNKCVPKNESLVQCLRKENLKNSVLIPVRSSYIDADQEISYLRTIVKKSAILAGNNYYLQERGVSQGGVVSGLLCDLYFANMEINCLSELCPRRGEFADRYRDDYLFITPDLERAKTFLTKMVNGFPEYNCTINIDKTLTNLNVECLGFPVGFPDLKTTKIIKWLGLHIDTETLAVTSDFSWNQHSHSAPNFAIDRSLSKDSVRHKLLSAIQSNSDMVLFSAKLNPSVDKNIYDTSLATACKLVGLITAIKSSDRPNNNAKYYLDTILMCSSVFVSKIYTNNCDILPFSSEEVTWIVLQAFLIKLASRSCLSLTNNLVCRIKRLERLTFSRMEKMKCEFWKKRIVQLRKQK